MNKGFTEIYFKKCGLNYLKIPDQRTFYTNIINNNIRKSEHISSLKNGGPIKVVNVLVESNETRYDK